MILKTDNAKILKYISNNSLEKSFKGFYEDGLINLYLEKYNLKYFESNKKNIEYYIYSKNNINIGMIGIKKNIIEDFFVLKKYQNIGIGTELLKFIIELAKRRGITKLKLESTKTGRKFYEAKGFIFIKNINKKKGKYSYVNGVYEINI